MTQPQNQQPQKRDQSWVQMVADKNLKGQKFRKDNKYLLSTAMIEQLGSACKRCDKPKAKSTASPETKVVTDTETK